LSNAEAKVARFHCVGTQNSFTHAICDCQARGICWSFPSVPRLARGLTEECSHRYRLHAIDADVIVAVRSYLGLSALGMARATNAPVVDELDREYAQATVSVCPILVGSGTRTKIIEAWLHEVPVVSTSIGADGLGAVHDENLLLADEPLAFADQIVRLISDRGLARRLSASARTLAQDTFSLDVVASAVAEVVLPLVTDRSRTFVMASNLHLTETEDGLVVLDRSNDSVHNLNSTAAMVLYLADGTLDQLGIAEELCLALGLDESPINHVTEALDQLCRIGLVSERIT